MANDNKIKAVTKKTLPDWQISLGKQELQNVAKGTAELMKWSEAKKQFKL